MGKDLSRRMVKDSLGQTIERVQQDIDSIKKGKKRPDSIDQLTSNLGIMEYGEFRVGNSVAPGTGFTGVRMLYPGATYGGEVYNLVGVNDDALQWGGRLSDGVFVAGGGNVFIDDNGVTLLTGVLGANSIKWQDPSTGQNVHLMNSNVLAAAVTHAYTLNAAGVGQKAACGESRYYRTPTEYLFNNIQVGDAPFLFWGLEYFDGGAFQQSLIYFNLSGAVFNEFGHDRDFRIESDTRPYAVFVQGSDGKVGINNSSPTADLHVDGEIAVVRQDATIASGAITATSNWIQLTSQSGTSDDLDTINGMVPGAEYTLQAAGGHAITVTDGSGLNLAGSASFTISGALDKLRVFARGASAADELTRSNN